MEERPDSPEAVQESVRQALKQGAPLRLFAGGTKGVLGRRVQGEPLDLSGLQGVLSYEPGELVLVARAGTRLAEVEKLLEAENQHLAFEPPCWGAEATLGGIAACNLSGPRRFKAGALRDHLLGVQLVDGRGELVRGGGRVVKNVTGYDLPRALAGSFGTLGAFTELCFKVWPRPETQATLVERGLETGVTLERMLAWSRLPLEVTGLAYEAGERCFYARVEGPGPAVGAQIQRLREQVAGEVEVLEEAESAAFWRRWRELEWLVPGEGEQRWRFSGPPSRMGRLAHALRAEGLRRWGFDWGGGLIWGILRVDADVGVIHRTAARHEAVAWRFARRTGERNEEAFTPPNGGVMRMNHLLKRAMDPKKIFNPGAMYALDEE